MSFYKESQVLSVLLKLLNYSKKTTSNQPDHEIPGPETAERDTLNATESFSQVSATSVRRSVDAQLDQYPSESRTNVDKAEYLNIDQSRSNVDESDLKTGAIRARAENDRSETVDASEWDGLERELCQLWDASFHDPRVCLFAVRNEAVDVFEHVLKHSNHSRLQEICIGISVNVLAQLKDQKVTSDLSNENDLCRQVLDTLIDPVLACFNDSDDPLTLVQVVRFLAHFFSISKKSETKKVELSENLVSAETEDGNPDDFGEVSANSDTNFEKIDHLRLVKDIWDDSVVDKLIFILNSSTNEELLAQCAGFLNSVLVSDQINPHAWIWDLMGGICAALNEVGKNESAAVDLLHSLQILTTSDDFERISGKMTDNPVENGQTFESGDNLDKHPSVIIEIKADHNGTTVDKMLDCNAADMGHGHSQSRNVDSAMDELENAGKVIDVLTAACDAAARHVLQSAPGSEWDAADMSHSGWLALASAASVLAACQPILTQLRKKESDFGVNPIDLECSKEKNSEDETVISESKIDEKSSGVISKLKNVLEHMPDDVRTTYGTYVQSSIDILAT